MTIHYDYNARLTGPALESIRKKIGSLDAAPGGVTVEKKKGEEGTNGNNEDPKKKKTSKTLLDKARGADSLSRLEQALNTRSAAAFGETLRGFAQASGAPVGASPRIVSAEGQEVFFGSHAALKVGRDFRFMPAWCWVGPDVSAARPLVGEEMWPLAEDFSNLLHLVPMHTALQEDKLGAADDGWAVPDVGPVFRKADIVVDAASATTPAGASQLEELRDQGLLPGGAIPVIGTAGVGKSYFREMMAARGAKVYVIGEPGSRISYLRESPKREFGAGPPALMWSVPTMISVLEDALFRAPERVIVVDSAAGMFAGKDELGTGGISRAGFQAVQQLSVIANALGKVIFLIVNFRLEGAAGKKAMDSLLGAMNGVATGYILLQNISSSGITLTSAFRPYLRSSFSLTLKAT